MRSPDEIRADLTTLRSTGTGPERVEARHRLTDDVEPLLDEVERMRVAASSVLSESELHAHANPAIRH